MNEDDDRKRKMIKGKDSYFLTSGSSAMAMVVLRPDFDLFINMNTYKMKRKDTMMTMLAYHPAISVQAITFDFFSSPEA